MEICKFEKNIKEVERRSKLPIFGDISEIVILERIDNYEFIKCEEEEVHVESSEEEDDVYVPSFNFPPVTKPKIEDSDTYVPPINTVIQNEPVSVKISNYALDITRTELLNILQQYSKVRAHRLHMVMDKETGKSLGYGFVRVNNKGDALQLINDLKVVIIDNFRLCVEIAKNKQN